MHDDWIMPLGKHKGDKLIDIPVAYLDWLIGQDWLRPDTKALIYEHLENSRKAAWEAISDNDSE